MRDRIMQFERTFYSIRKGTTIWCVVACVGFCALAKGAGSIGSKNPYHLIVKRNVFGLRPPPPIKVAQPPPPEVPKVTLTGITTILKGKRALLKVQFPAKPPARPKEESYILAEGKRKGPITVLAINENTGFVKINNSGTEMNITFPKLAPKPAVTAKPPRATARPRVPYPPRFPVRRTTR